MQWSVTSVIVFLLIDGHNSLENGLLRKPPMGWLTWQRFRCVTDCRQFPDTCISEKLIRTQAKLLVDGGYLAAGYEYIIIDDCWLNNTRAADGSLQPDDDRFPSGIRSLADYVHSLGLKFGIYEDYGTQTCAGYPGVLGHLEQDAQTFASWKVDYLKLDGCNADIKDFDTGYPSMGHALNATGYPIAYSCSWPAYQEFSKMKPNYAAISQACNLWRNWGDIDDSWDSVYSIIQWFGDNQDRLAPFHGPGHWNDPDMIVVGNYGLSPGQSRAQMALWSIMAAPLILSVDLRAISEWAREIILNKNLISINQDPLGQMGRRIVKLDGNVEIWSKTLIDDRTAFVALFPQPYGTPIQLSVNLTDLGLGRFDEYDFFETFHGEFLGKYHKNERYSFTINPSGDVHAFYVESAIAKTLRFKV
ncbi:unnamed protein product [Rotaria socialis]|uniref:Alpha-galactosidase n=2 Tax=Rotaria socialis TaxID=392032 RepID=A0A818SNG8_9BILA|nr:unnamed protein product [Rotaria socialis]CAF3522578.1 unnamed protein product [Rotaria socialis]CAF3673676.1 unnamed protein product [Rotaria socialis]CAF4330457.1 unnamed protein product [Rotaria socialis]CAF4562613.1 unnamed protein product [Rotaria socialis]